jgi:threonine aldolase
LAEAWAAQGLSIELERVQSNFVQIDVGVLGLGEWEAVDLLLEAGVALSRTMRPGVLRAVTHLDLTDDDIGRALELVPSALGTYARA